MLMRVAKAIPAIAFAFALVWVQYQHIGGHRAADVPHFTLTDHHGKTVTEQDFRGKFTLIYFGYTLCPDVCPTSLSSIAEALALMGEDGRKITPVMVSFDPDRDPPSVLADYVAAFCATFIGLTGTKEQIEDAAKQFAVYFKRVGDGENYVMDHSAIFYLLAPDGRLAATIMHGTAPSEMAKTREGQDTGAGGTAHVSMRCARSHIAVASFLWM
jgi:cytochrome oxidase Cu insertion factor (SCO1/SenC/PrrC family)